MDDVRSVSKSVSELSKKTVTKKHNGCSLRSPAICKIKAGSF